MLEIPVQFTRKRDPGSGASDSLAEISRYLRALGPGDVFAEFSIPHQGQLLKTTISICPDCGRYVPAAVVSIQKTVWMYKKCNEHGLQTATLENDINFYRLSNKDSWGVRYNNEWVTDFPEYSSCCSDSGCCGEAKPVPENEYASQLDNKSCTILIEITNACNIKCRVCYARADGDRVVPFAHLRKVVETLCRQKPEIDSIQLTGGEAILHPQFWEIVDWIYAKKQIGKIYLPTNGIEFAKKGVVDKLRKYKDRILVLLQFDGEVQQTNQLLRNSDSRKIKQKLIRELNRAGITMQLTMSLARRVNEEEIAWVIQQGLQNRNVRLIGMLPVFYTGRYDLPRDPVDRLCLSDIAKHIVGGLGKYVKESDFMPIPCSHPNCGWTTLFIRRFGVFTNIVRYVNPEAAKNNVAYKTVLNEEEMKSVVGTKSSGLTGWIKSWLAKKLVRPKDVFGIAIKPFMDQFTYDQDRVSSCCHHIVDTDGNLVSFCEYNTRLREKDSWNQFPYLEAEREKGRPDSD